MYNKSLCMQLCFYDPNKMSKGHFVPKGGAMSYLEIFFLSNKGDIYLLVVIFLYWYYFFGEPFMVKLSYYNITIFHLKYEI